MESNNTSRRIHPLVAGAAASVMLVSLTGVAAITGLIPNSHSTGAQATSSVGATPSLSAESRTDADSAALQAKSTPAEKHSYAPRAAQSSHSQARKTSYAVAQGPASCSSCGRVESVNAIQHAAKPSGVGMVAGAVLGGVLGNQVGGGNGRKVATVAGAVGGGYAGNEIEKSSRATTSYQVRVRMDGGEIRSFPYAQPPGWGVGDRVRVVDGQLTSRA
jgi:outer membrane lipoprotein SlyB